MLFKEYLVRVHRGIDSKNTWTVRKRYREFDDLNSQLKCFNIDLQLPQKKLFGNMNKDFISSRQNQLQVIKDLIKIYFQKRNF